MPEEDETALSETMAMRVLNRWRNLFFLRNAVERRTELQALESMPLFCTYRGARYRVLGFDVQSGVLLSNPPNTCTATLDECKEWRLFRKYRE